MIEDKLNILIFVNIKNLPILSCVIIYKAFQQNARGFNGMIESDSVIKDILKEHKGKGVLR